MDIGILITGGLGIVGWFFAWLGQRSVVEKDREVADAKAGEVAARQIALAAEAKSLAAEAKLAAEASRSSGLQLQLDAERKARQDLVHELASKGLPVGDAVVDAAVDRLYPDDHQGGQGPGVGPGGDPSGLPGQPPAASGRAPDKG